MSGHSKWSTIKRKKGAKDAKRGAIFSKLARVIEVAARGGADLDSNFRLKLAVQQAKTANMPSLNIDKAIKKGSGQDKEASQIEEITYEGLGPGNVAIVVKALTDNKNRTVADLRHAFSKVGGVFGSAVGWQFEERGILHVDALADTDSQELAIIDSGATDFDNHGDEFEIYTAPRDLDRVKSALETAGMHIVSASLGLVAKNPIRITDPHLANKILGLLEALEDHDDVDEVFSNLDIPDEVLNQLS